MKTASIGCPTVPTATRRSTSTFPEARRGLALLGLLGWAALGCGSSNPDLPDAGSCAAAPSACPSPVPSYQGQVAGILQSRCLICHSAGGVGTPRLDSYAAQHRNELLMLSQVAGCRMPSPDAGQLTDAERTALLAWLACGAPDN